jgi:type I restriction enzyme, R subunit
MRVGQPERATQNRVIALFGDELRYRYLGDWTDRDGNSNIEEGRLTAWLTKSGYTPAQIGVALHKLRIEADEPRKVSPFDNLTLLDLIVKTGIANAIASQLGGLKANENAIAETIENNVRSKIIKEHLNDPAYYEKMSALLDEIIAARKAKAIEYEEYLKRIAELAKRVETGHADDTPEQLKNSPALRALYNNLKKDSEKPERTVGVAEEPGDYEVSSDPALKLALKIDETVKRVRPDAWRGHQAKENTIKAALLALLGNDVAEVERMFLIIKAQGEY